MKPKPQGTCIFIYWIYLTGVNMYYNVLVSVMKSYKKINHSNPKLM